MEERISGAEDSIENIDTTVKENTKCKRILTQNIQEIQDTMPTGDLEEKQAPLCTAGGNAAQSASLESSMENPQKAKKRIHHTTAL